MNQQLNEKIDTLFNEYMKNNGCEPQYAKCSIQYLDNGCSFECNIKLSADDGGEEDDNAFFYCNSLSDLKSLTKKGCEDFVITDCSVFFRLTNMNLTREEELEKALKLLLEVTCLEIPCFEQSETFRVCERALAIE